LSDLTHLQRIRQELPATLANIYLNTGTFGPLPTCTIQAMQERMQFEWQNGRLGMAAFEKMFAIYTDTRDSVARLLNAHMDEIALTASTGEGMNIISNGLNWQEGDEVITTDHEHISALAPLYQNRERYGIVVRKAELGIQADRPVLEAISPLVTEYTRLISLSHVTWTTGARLDVAAVTRFGRERGIPVLIDGAQSAGAIPIDVKALDVDFYAIPMQKWLCGPDGTGALYVKKEAMRYVSPTNVGYWSIKHEEGIEWELKENAQRFELGGRHTAALVGQSAVLNWLEHTVGYAWMFEHIAALNTYAYSALQQVPGLKMLTPQPEQSGILAFILEGRDDKEIVTQLCDKHGIIVRNIPETHAIRISTSFYNTEEEIDALVGALSELS
jgi:L-cysteine/cystine lyase